MYKKITEDVIKQIYPQRFVENVLRVQGNRMVVDERGYNLQKNVSVIGFGKASLGMYQSLKRILGQHIKKSFISVPTQDEKIPYTSRDTSRDTTRDTAHVTMETVVSAAKNNLPDENTLLITRDIIKHAESLGSDDICICLISGGGSALLCDPIVPLSDMLTTIRLLTTHSATITQLNLLRSYLCRVKGGGLASYISPAPVVSLIMSDVIGNPLQAIASGPTVDSKISRQDIQEMLSSLNITTHQLPSSIQQLLLQNYLKQIKTSNDVYNRIIASNQIALKLAVESVEREGYCGYIVTDKLVGEARIVGSDIVSAVIGEQCELLEEEIARKIRGIVAEGKSKACLIFGGETTVTMTGRGVGGRCQELALSAASRLDKTSCTTDGVITLVATSTDGQDGPTNASGAIVAQNTASEARMQGLDIASFLRANDSYSFFSRLNEGENLLKSGLTGTNLMDIVFVFIDKSVITQSEFNDAP